jgi:Protein phosphatase 2C
VWRHIAQSVQGLHHRAEGTPCQDCCLVRVLGDGASGALVACIADGAGSSEHSGVGAGLACESIIESAERYIQEKCDFARLQANDVIEWCEVARRKIVDHAELRDRTLRDYASTLCAAVISPQGSIFFQIGDGAIIVKKNDVYGVVFWPQSGEYINTTNFLTSKEFLDHVQIQVTEDGFSDVALLTDGIERLALRFDSLTPHPPFFRPLFDALRATTNVEALAEDLRQFLQSESIQNKTDDDKTLVLASRILQ